MGTLTTNYQFEKPTVGGDEDMWGDDYAGGDPMVDPSPGLSGNWEKLDQLMLDQETKLAELEAEIALIPDDLLKLQLQIGDLYITTDTRNPSAILEYGTWVPWGVGRALVGVGNNGESTWEVDDERGVEEHLLIADEIPLHDHSVNPASATTNSTGSHNHSYNRSESKSNASGNENGSGYYVDDKTPSTNGDHTHTIDLGVVNLSEAGADTPHNNTQLGDSVYIWERTE